MNLLMAVLEKRCRYEMSRLDAYVNIAGGMRMNEPALDLAIVMALMSSYKDRPVDPGMLIFGEVGLSGGGPGGFTGGQTGSRGSQDGLYFLCASKGLSR